MTDSTVPSLSSADRRSLRGRGLDASRPQVGLKAGFEPGERGDVRPDLSAEDDAECRVIDARHIFQGPEASPGENHPQPDDEASGDLSGRIIAGKFGPACAEGVRSRSGGPGHTPSVDVPSSGPVVPTTARVTSLCHTGDTNHHVRREVTVAQRIREFTPNMPEAYWQVIEGFVRTAVADSVAATPYTASDLLTVVARLALWCWQTAGLALDREVVFDRTVIDEYIVHGCPTLAQASAGNRRSQLLRVAEALHQSGQPVRLSPLPTSDPVRPYSPAEMTALRSWAAGQSTLTRRRDAHTLLALGAGAGLAVEDISGLTAGMVTVDDEGVLIAVPGRRARPVPMLASWETPLIDAVESVPAARLLFCANRTTTGKNFVSSFVHRSAGVSLKPSTQRLRATWIVTHLVARTPVVPLMTAAGVVSLEALTRYLRYLPGIDPVVARRALTTALLDSRSE